MHNSKHDDSGSLSRDEIGIDHHADDYHEGGQSFTALKYGEDTESPDFSISNCGYESEI